MPQKYIDLFCGLGAFHEAFKGTFECVLACDIDEGARRIYAANHGLLPEGDIRKLTVIPDFDILCAGFPCQPFSIAGNGAGFSDDEKGNLFFEILRIIDAKTPEMCILENVKNMKTHDGGRTYVRIQSELEKRGYSVTSEVLNAAKYGSPQARERLFIVASRRGAFELPSPSNTERVVADILEPVQSNLDLSRYVLRAKETDRRTPFKPRSLFDLVNSQTGNGGRQGERVYDPTATGVTVCASSGGPGAKTGLYMIDGTIRRLTVLETKRMFGFPDTYAFEGTSDEKSLFYLGNSIVVDVARSFIPGIQEYFRATAP
jgi:DNA (cytosine-5)-methyltransferase 1